MEIEWKLNEELVDLPLQVEWAQEGHGMAVARSKPRRSPAQREEACDGLDMGIQ